MLDQITKSYSELQGQLLMAMQKQAQEKRQEQVNMILVPPRSWEIDQSMWFIGLELGWSEASIIHDTSTFVIFGIVG